MSASRSQADLPGREWICVNDASVCRCMTQITMIWALTLVYRTAFSPLQLCCVNGYWSLFQCFSVEKCTLCVACGCPAVFHVSLTDQGHDFIMWIFGFQLWRFFRRCKKVESAPLWCCKTQFYNIFYGNRTTKWLITIIPSAQHGQIS